MSAKERRIFRAFCVAVFSLWAVAAIAFAPETVGAQCSMCQTAARAGGDEARRTILTGMLVLLVPSVAIFCSIFVVIFKYGSAKGDDDSSEAEDVRER